MNVPEGYSAVILSINFPDQQVPDQYLPIVEDMVFRALNVAKDSAV